MIKLYALGMNTYNFGTWVRNILGHRRKNRRVLKDLCQWYCRHHCFHTAQKSMAILNEELEKRLYEKYESLRTYLLTVVVEKGVKSAIADFIYINIKVNTLSTVQTSREKQWRWINKHCSIQKRKRVRLFALVTIYRFPGCNRCSEYSTTIPEEGDCVYFSGRIGIIRLSLLSRNIVILLPSYH